MAITLSAKAREIPFKEINKKRALGGIPAELYGKSQINRHLVVEATIFKKVFAQAGESSLVDLSIDGGQPIKVLIYDVQKDPVTDRIIHADLYQIDMNKPFTFTIPLVFVGESKAVKELEGTLVKNIDEVEISCLPKDLIHEIEIDISSLQAFHEMIKVKDLKLPQTIKIKTDLEKMIATVAPHHVEEAPVAASSPAEEVAAEGEKPEGAETAADKTEDKPKKSEEKSK
jgi:large subunit ribosomal protein L25